MCRVFVLLAVVVLTGCQTSQPASMTPMATNAAWHLVVSPRTDGGMYAGGWSVSKQDIPQFVAQHRVTSAIIHGGPLEDYGDALKLQATLKAAGVADVSIGTAGE